MSTGFLRRAGGRPCCKNASSAGKAGHRNISIQVGNGTLGWEEHAPYDAVVISAAAPCIPPQLVQQLKEGGCLVLPVGEEETQTLMRLRKEREGLEEEYLGECQLVKLRHRCSIAYRPTIRYGSLIDFHLHACPPVHLASDPLQGGNVNLPQSPFGW